MTAGYRPAVKSRSLFTTSVTTSIYVRPSSVTRSPTRTSAPCRWHWTVYTSVEATESLRLSIYTWIASLVIVMVMLPLCVLPLYRKWQRNLLLHENHLGHNARVPTIYIRDQIDHMHDVPFQNIHNTHTLSSGESSSSQSSHFSTQPRHRRLLCNSNESGSTTKDAQHVDTILHIPTPPPYTTNHYGMMQSRYPNYHDHDT